MNIVIEPYSASYDDQIAKLIISIQTQEYKIPITLDDQPDLLDIRSFYQRGLGNFWIARDGEHLIGTVALLDIGNQQVALRKMFVEQEYRGRQKVNQDRTQSNVAAALLQQLLCWCRSRQVNEIYLGTTAAFLSAHRFYEKNGFVKIPPQDLPASFPVLAVDSFFYRLVL